MNSFYGGVPGASFVIVKRFDCIDSTNLPIENIHQIDKYSRYACDNENNIYIYAYKDKDNITRYYPIVRNEVNKYYYEFWYGHRDNGSQIPILRSNDINNTDYINPHLKFQEYYLYIQDENDNTLVRLSDSPRQVKDIGLNTSTGIIDYNEQVWTKDNNYMLVQKKDTTQKYYISDRNTPILEKTLCVNAADVDDEFYANNYRYAVVIKPANGTDERALKHTNDYDKFTDPNTYYNFICQTFKPEVETIPMINIGSRWYRIDEDNSDRSNYIIAYYIHYDPTPSKCITSIIQLTPAEYAQKVTEKSAPKIYAVMEADDFGGNNEPPMPVFFNKRIEGMRQCFEQGGATNNEVGFGEYVIIDSSEYTGWAENPDNGKVFRRGLNYQYNAVTNPLAGAEYVGRILGPQGESIPTIVTSLDDVNIEDSRPADGQKKTYRIGNYCLDSEHTYNFGGTLENETNATDANTYYRIHYKKDQTHTHDYYGWIYNGQHLEEATDGSKDIVLIADGHTKEEFLYEGFFNKPIYVPGQDNADGILYRMYIENAQDLDKPYSDMLPGAYYNDNGALSYNDEIHYGWVTIRDAHTNKVVGTKIGFKFPYHVFKFEAEAVSPYYERDDYSAETGDFEPSINFNNRNVMTRTDDGKHPFYQQYQFHIPKGKHGKDVVEIFSQPERKLNLRTNQLRIEYTVQKSSYDPSDAILIDSYLEIEQNPAGHTDSNYIFAKDNRQWYKRDNGIFKRWSVNKYEDSIHENDLIEDTYYADYEYPYNIYKVYSGKGGTITRYNSQFMENEDNSSIYDPDHPEHYIFSGTDLYNITDLSIENNYIEFEIVENGVRTPYWCHYDEKIVDNAYPDECLYSKYINYERFAIGETDVIYFGPITEFKEVSLESNGKLNIYYAHREDLSPLIDNDYGEQLYWIDRAESKDQRDLLFYYCDANKTLAKELPNSIQKLDYFYIENYKFKENKRPNIKYWKAIAANNIITIDSGDSEVFNDLKYNCIYYVSQNLVPPIAADGKRHNVDANNQYVIGFYKKDNKWFNQLKPMTDNDTIDHYAKYRIVDNNTIWNKKSFEQASDLTLNTWGSDIEYSTESDYINGNDENAHIKYLDIDALFYKNLFNPTKEGYENKTQTNYATHNQKEVNDTTSYKFVSIDYEYDPDWKGILNKEGEGDQKIHYSLNNEEGDQSIGLPINYIMDTVITKPAFVEVAADPTVTNPYNYTYEYELNDIIYAWRNNGYIKFCYYPKRQKEIPTDSSTAIVIDSTKWVSFTEQENINDDYPKIPKPYHLLVLYSDPKRRIQNNVIYYSEHFNEFRTDWVDLGYCNNRIDAAKIAGYIDNVELLTNENPPERLFHNSDYRGWCVLCGNAIWAYDYEAQHWYKVEEFTNNMWPLRRVYVDNRLNGEGNDLNNGSYSYPFKTIERALDVKQCQKVEIVLKGNIDFEQTKGYELKAWRESTKDFPEESADIQAIDVNEYIRPNGSTPIYLRYFNNQDESSRWLSYETGVWTEITNDVVDRNNQYKLLEPAEAVLNKFYFLDNKLYKCVNGKNSDALGDEIQYTLNNYIGKPCNYSYIYIEDHTMITDTATLSLTNIELQQHVLEIKGNQGNLTISNLSTPQNNKIAQLIISNYNNANITQLKNFEVLNTSANNIDLLQSMIHKEIIFNAVNNIIIRDSNSNVSNQKIKLVAGQDILIDSINTNTFLYGNTISIKAGGLITINGELYANDYINLNTTTCATINKPLTANDINIQVINGDIQDGQKLIFNAIDTQVIKTQNLNINSNIPVEINRSINANNIKLFTQDLTTASTMTIHTRELNIQGNNIVLNGSIYSNTITNNCAILNWAGNINARAVDITSTTSITLSSNEIYVDSFKINSTPSLIFNNNDANIECDSFIINSDIQTYQGNYIIHNGKITGKNATINTGSNFIIDDCVMIINGTDGTDGSLTISQATITGNDLKIQTKNFIDQNNFTTKSQYYLNSLTIDAAQTYISDYNDYNCNQIIIKSPEIKSAENIYTTNVLSITDDTPSFVKDIFNNTIFNFNSNTAENIKLYLFNTVFNSCHLLDSKVTIEGAGVISYVITDGYLFTLNNSIINIKNIKTISSNSDIVKLPVLVAGKSQLSIVDDIDFTGSSITNFTIQDSSELYIPNNILLPNDKITYKGSSYIYTGRSKRMIQSLTREEYENMTNLDANIAYIITYTVDPDLINVSTTTTGESTTQP